MTTNTNDSSSALELIFELKYCERCGGLWLRPVAGGQIYCRACACALGDLPPVSCELTRVRGPQMPQGPRWGMDESDYDEDGNFDLDASGGVA
jgi:hypothetical protein